MHECQLTFYFRNLYCDTVKKAISRLTSSSVGPYNASIKTYKALLPYYLPVITDFFNFSVSSGEFPTEWKKFYVVPLPKKA